MTRSGTVLAFLAVSLAAACASAPAFEPREWSATIDEGGDNEVRANVRAATAPGQTAVSINLAGADANATHPWHVHRGTCGNDQGIVGDPAAYTPLSTNASGAAQSMAHIRVQLAPGESYMVNVHRSPSALGDIIGCAALR